MPDEVTQNKIMQILMNVDPDATTIETSLSYLSKIQEFKAYGIDHFRRKLDKRQPHKKTSGRKTQEPQPLRSDRKPVAQTAMPERESFLDHSIGEQSQISKKERDGRHSELIRFNLTKNFEQFQQKQVAPPPAPQQEVYHGKRNIALREYQSHIPTTRGDNLSSAGGDVGEGSQSPVMLLKMID